MPKNLLLINVQIQCEQPLRVQPVPWLLWRGARLELGRPERLFENMYCRKLNETVHVSVFPSLSGAVRRKLPSIEYRGMRGNFVSSITLCESI